ncbi:integral membrane protein S linking to the trans Golgi network-domain-containing protein [Helicostylum pulchrum]|nr:integral membrane protein S linking to the trans Golgi network-domain-containing protein [Helicostylum pulchrum]
MASSFRASKWDPILIIAQITSLQSLCYILYSIILYIALTLTGTDASLDLIFSDKEIRTDTGFGWSLIIVWVVNACLSIPILMLIVQRAKQILDYVLTFHFFHLICVWKISHHFPTGTSWWVLQVVNIVIMTFGGEWACMHREMKPIMIKSGVKNKNKDVNLASSSSSSNTVPEDEEGLLNKKSKRKASDAAPKEVEDDQGALLAAVGKAKKALMSTSGRSKRNTRKYDVIPMKDMDQDTNTN